MNRKCSFIQYLLSTYYVIRPVLGTQDMRSSTTCAGSCPHRSRCRGVGMGDGVSLTLPVCGWCHLSCVPSDGAPQTDKVVEQGPGDTVRKAVRPKTEGGQSPRQGRGGMLLVAGTPFLHHTASQASMTFPEISGSP